MYLGVDLGTSGIKLVVTSENGEVRDTASAPLNTQRPHPLWAEQNPLAWWEAFQQALLDISKRHNLRQIKAIGLSGQMHGAVLLDAFGNVLRPVILWNDGRSQSQCEWLEDNVDNARDITGNRIMPGFTAPKLLWIKQHEPEVFAAIHKVLLPKDYLRYLLTGEYASDMSDSSGTMWMNVSVRHWDSTLLSACGLDESHMPNLYEGNEVTGYLKASLAQGWGMDAVPVIAGGGDNAAGAIGLGIVKAKQGMLSLGTSGVYFVVSDGFRANPDAAVHSFCHALPEKWHLMSVTLSAASCLQWFAEAIIQKPIDELMSRLPFSGNESNKKELFLPYLSGERTPHNDPKAKGVFFGLTHQSNQESMLCSVLEGITFALREGMDAVNATGIEAEEITLVGGGSKSVYWRQMIADILNRPVTYRTDGDVGPALGAARLAQLGSSPDLSVQDVCPMPTLEHRYYPNPEIHARYSQRYAEFKDLYRRLRPSFDQN